MRGITNATEKNNGLLEARHKLIKKKLKPACVQPWGVLVTSALFIIIITTIK
jgi:hypothetical protein